MNLVDAELSASELSGVVTVCAVIEGVTDIEQGFTGQFDLIDGTAGKRYYPYHINDNVFKSHQ